MAASEANPLDKSTYSKPILSEYASKLDKDVKKRYVDKISLIGIDPFLIPTEKLTTEFFPPVKACDILAVLFGARDKLLHKRPIQQFQESSGL